MRKVDLSNVQASTNMGSKKLMPGGYVCSIIRVTDVPEKEYLKVEFEITEGDFSGYYGERAERFGGASLGVYVASYKEKAKPLFKAFVTSVEESNRGFKWDGEHEMQFVGKLIGFIFGEVEYEFNGRKGMTVKPRVPCSTQTVWDGEYALPKPRYLNGNTPAIPNTVDDIPFTMVVENESDLPF